MTHTRETTPTVGAPRRTRMITYLVLGVIVLVLAVSGLLIYQSGEESRDAEAKADRLAAQLEEFGLRTPSKDQIVRVLGNDGGATCADPNNALVRASAAGLLTNGAGGPGLRPVIADVKVLQGTLAVISVYCPDKVGEFQQYADDLKTADVAG